MPTGDRVLKADRADLHREPDGTYANVCLHDRIFEAADIARAGVVRVQTAAMQMAARSPPVDRHPFANAAAG